jgi:16S rRNA (cytosine1402-N4)-methyltransferase
VQETIEMLDVKEAGTYVDATLGLGGHAAALLSHLGPAGTCVGIDRDDEALAHAKGVLGNGRLILRKGNFSQIAEILHEIGIGSVDGVLFDLGVSMLQIREPRRGFSFSSEERLDMRMDPSQELTAWDVVNGFSEKEIERIVREFGDERHSRRIARAIAVRRQRGPINTCIELANLVAAVCRKRGRIHPATKTFQALRMEVNGEVQEVRNGLSSALKALRRGGRLSVISYHSIEDRIVKHFIRDGAREGLLRIITKKPVTPRPDELRENPSSRSAKLRGAERL